LNEAPISPPRFRFTTLFWVGLGLFVVGTGPLLAVILLSALGLTKDPNPNPIGFGLLAFLTFYPSVGLMVGGLVSSVKRHRAARKQFDE
jgi:hypothetical protein